MNGRSSSRLPRLPRLPPLTATGTARASFLGAAAPEADEAVPRDLRAALAARDVSDEIVWAAWEVIQWTAGASTLERRALACLVVALLAEVEAGGTFLSLGSAAGENGAADRLVQVLARIGVGESDRKAVATLAAGLVAGTAPANIAALVGPPGARRPFILAGGALYPERFWMQEERVVALVRGRLLHPASPLGDAARLSAAIHAVDAAPGALPLGDEQVAAVRAAMDNSFTMVAGGPGTGKTSTVVGLLRTLVRLGVPAHRIALAAPTGRAAQRMTESVAAALGRLKLPAQEDVELVTSFAAATTLHRLLGIRPAAWRVLDAQVPEFYAEWPLPHSVVIVDEASMIDLVLMERLCAAVAPQARLILMGDVDQLPSVQVGAVFRELVAGAPQITCRLTRSHRMDPADARGAEILKVAGAVNVGKSPLGKGTDTGKGKGSATPVAMRRRAADLAFAGFESLGAAQLSDFLDRWHTEILAAETTMSLALDRRYVLHAGDPVAGSLAGGARVVSAPAEDAAGLRRLLAIHASARILCLTRTAGRASSTAALNSLLHARVQMAALGRGVDESMAGASFIPGEPVIVSRNDHARGLANGDLGVVLRLLGGRGDSLGVAFAQSAEIVVHPLEAIRGDLSLAFALTVHKAQGSEYNRIALVLPETDVPLLTREVLYTALTRARHGVVVIGDGALFELGTSRTLDRTSGIAERLRRQ